MGDIRSGDIHVKGLAELEKQLLAFPDRIAKNVMAGAIRAGAVVIQKEAKDNAPRSEKAHRISRGKNAETVQPGFLKKNIKVRSAPRGTSDYKITYWVYVSGKAYYWRFIEFGTRFLPASSFMRRAFDTKKEEAALRIREYLAARIEKEAAKRGN